MDFLNLNNEDFKDGVIIPVNKPVNWSSFDVVRKIRYVLKYNRGIEKIKVGHAGTLDPKATGLLLICTGRATKKIEDLQKQKKTYQALIKLGAETPSYDTETDIIREFPVDHINQEKIEKVLTSFIGETEQLPPDYSAVKVGGKRSYKLARQGKKTGLRPRKVFIDKIDLKEYKAPSLNIEVKCGKGTYIRSLARDIGRTLDSGAFLESLIRSEIGNYKLKKSLSIEFIEKL